MRDKLFKNQCRDPKNSEKQLRDAVKLNPFNVQHYINLATVLWDTGKLPEALQLLTIAKDKFIGNERSIIENHIERISGAEDVWKDFVLAYTQYTEIQVPSEYCGHEGSKELLEEKLWGYAEGIMEEGDEERFWIQIQGCRYCLTKLIKIQRALNMAQKEPAWSYEKICHVIKKTQREKRVNTLMAKFAKMVKKSPIDLQKEFETIGKKLETLLRRTFTYPAPVFAPVFGEYSVAVLSPFGKVRYPIIFEWRPYEEADKYVISIEDVDWYYTTNKTRVDVDETELPLIYGNEYMWELKVIKEDEIIEEENGFFSLPTEKEVKEIGDIENQIKEIEPQEQKFILLGGILENKEFYMEAIEKYKKAYTIKPDPGVAYRIASCYDKLELEDLRDNWNKKIKSEK